MSDISDTSEKNLTERKHSSESSAKKGKGNDKSKSSPQGPKSKEHVTKTSVSEVFKSKKNEKVATRKLPNIKNKDSSDHEGKEKSQAFTTDEAKKTKSKVKLLNLNQQRRSSNINLRT